MRPKDAEGIANIVDPDQTIPLGAVWSGSALFAQAYLPENLGSLCYPKDAGGMASSVSLIRLPSGAVWSGSAIFALTYVTEGRIYRNGLRQIGLDKV